MSLTKFILFTFSILFSQVTVGQSFESVLSEGIKQLQTRDNYAINMEYVLYADSISNKIIERKNGVFIKKSDLYYFKMGDNEILFIDNRTLKINHKEKMMQYIKGGNQNIQSQHMFLQFMDNFKEKNISCSDQFWVCSMRNPKTELPFDKIDLYVDVQTKSIKKQVYFFKNSVEKQFKSGAVNTNSERLEILQNEIDASNIDGNLVLDISHYINETKTNIRPTYKFRSYEIILQ